MSTTPKVRTIDPAIAALRKEHADKVAELRKKAQSAKVLGNIKANLLGKLSTADTLSLAAHLNSVAPK